MALPWNEVANNPDFQNLPSDQQESARLQYFSDVVAPHVPHTELDTVRKQFDSETKPRSALGEIGTALKRGTIGQLPQMAGQAGEFIAGEFGAGPGNVAYDISKKVADYGTEQLNRPDMQLHPESHNAVTNFFASGAEMIPQSVAPMAAIAGAIALAPVELPALATTALASLGGGVLFGASQGQQTLEKAQKAGVAPDQAREASRITFAEESLGETVGNLILGWGFGALEKAGTQAAIKTAGLTKAQVVFNAFKNPSWFQDFAKKLPGEFAGEIGTEMAQNYSEAATEKAYGIDNQDPWEAAKQAISPTAAMTTILLPLGAMGHYKAAQQSRAITSTLESPNADPKLRTIAANTVYQSLKTADPAAAEAWGNNAQEAIKANRPILLDESFAVPQTDAEIGASIVSADNVDSAIDAAVRATSGATTPIAGVVTVPPSAPVTGIINQARSSRSGAEMLPVTPADVGTVQGTPLLGKGVSGAEPVPFSREEVRAMNLGKTLTHQYETPPSELNQPVPPSSTNTVQPEAAPAAPKRVQTLKDAVVRQGGINPEYRMDILGDTKGNYNIPGVGHLFTKTGDSLDGMAEKLTEEGWFTEEQRNSGDATRLLSTMIRDELTGIKEHINPGNVTAFDAKMKAEMEHYYGDQGRQEDPFVNAPPADLEVSGYNMADEPTKDLTALYAVGRRKMGSDAFDDMLERLASQNENIDDNAFEALVRKEVDNHGKDQGKAAAASASRGGHLPTTGEVVGSAQQGKEGAAAPPSAEVTAPTLKAPPQGGVSVPASEKLTPVSKRKPADYGSTNKIVSTERANELREKLRKKLNQVSAGIDPELFAMASELSVYHIEAGARSFAAYSKAMLSDLGDKIKPYLKALYLGARNWPGIDKAGMDTEAQLETAEKTAPGQTADMLGGKNSSQQAIHDAEIERQKKMAEAPPVEAGEGDLFSGKAKQTDIEDVTKAKPIDERLVPKSAISTPALDKIKAQGNHEEQKFKVGERVVINNNHNEEMTGRHGVVTEAKRIGWTTTVLFGSGPTESSSSYTYHVKTDAGVETDMRATDLEVETGIAPKVSDDVKMPEGLYTPRHALQLIEHSKGYIRNAEAAAERARNADKIEGHKKAAERYRKELDARTRAFEAWAALNPEEAAKVRGELSTAKADENWWNHELTPVGRENAANEAGIKIQTNTTRWNYIGMSEREKLSAVRASGKNLDSGSATETAVPVVAGDAAATLKAAGLTVRKTKTNKGSDVWEVSGDTRAHKDTIKSMGGRWYGPKKVWSFYKGDPSERLAERLPKPKTVAAAAITETPATPIPPPRDKEKTPFEEGQAAFSAGKTRIAPMAMSSEEMTEWYRGWDKANLAAPVPGEIDEQANEGRIVSEETTNAPAQQPNLEAGNRGGNIEARPAGRTDRRPLGVGVEEGNLGAGTERGTAGENQEPGGTGSTNAGGREGGRAEQPPGASRTDGAVRDQSERRPVTGRQDFTITDADEIGVGGTKTKYQNNVAAIRLLKQITEQDRLATPEEQAILAKYVGWGGIKGAFDPNNKGWTKEYTELKDLLTQEEYEAARRSILDAHYTSVPIVRGIWSGLRRMGFDGGRVLEPSVGVGNFFGLMPKGLRSASTLLGVELDRITGAIAHHLYQTADISSPMGFQAINLPSGSFDAVVGNPPFGSQKLFDANHKELSKFSIHNFFIAKALDKLRPGGVMGIVVSRYFLDAQDSTARQYIAERANILGAVRLPYTAFKGNANTEVVTDVIFLQKLEEGESPDLSWVDTADIDVEGTPARVNQYYSDNPDNVLGTFARTGSMYGKDELTVEPSEVSIEDGIARFVQTLPENIYAKSGMTEAQVNDAIEGAVPEHTKVGGYFVAEDGKLARRASDSNRTDDSGQPVRRYEVAPEMPKATERRVRDLIGVRDALRSLMRAEMTQVEDSADLSHLRDVLNRRYNAFMQTHGYINAQANRRAFAEDPDLPLLESLEPEYDPGVSRDAAKRKGTDYRPAKAEKAAIFRRRVLAPYTHVTNVDNPQDSLAASLNERGKVDLAYMEEITGTDQETLIRELSGLIYRNPETDLHEIADEYLTGNVKAKLATAKEAVKTDKRFEENVVALEKVQPADVTASDISVKLGATWVPSDIVRDFVMELLGVEPSVAYIPSAGKWSFNVKSQSGTAVSGTAFTATWGTRRMPADDIIEAILNMRAIVVKDNHGTSREPNWVTNAPETQAARAKSEDVHIKFKDWIWLDPKRRERLESIWNNTMNTNRRRTYDGSHMQFPGMSPLVKMRKHQTSAVWRTLQDRQVLLDHTVGAGKTYVMVAAAMEMRRLGLARKPIFTVPNHLVRQWRDEFYHLYPSANILAATEKDFEKANRQRLFSRIATGDWDAVIVAHSSFTKIGMPAQQETEILNEMLRELTDAVRQMKDDRGDRNVIRDMERIKENLEAKLAKANAKAGARDRVVTFDELGADALSVDEAHIFKNLFFISSMKGVAGLGNPAGSGRAFDLFVKTRYLQTRFGGKGTTIFATGTPISNSLVEMYTMQRYLMYDDLKSRDMHLLDAWARAFGDVQQVYEVHPSGNGYRLATRFAKFVNMPELMTLYRKVADVVTLDDLKAQAKAEGKVFPVPKMKGGKPQLIVAERSPDQTKFFGVPTFARDLNNKIKFNHDNLTVELNSETEKYHVLGEHAQSISGPFDTKAEADHSRRQLMNEPVINYNEGSILWKFENLRRLTKDSNGKINALSITNEARKAGLDFRLIDANAADFSGSKINQAIDKIVGVHAKWKADKGAQLVFCDLSVPKSAKATAQSQERKVWVRDKDNAGALKEVKAVMHIVDGIEGAVFLIHKNNKKTDKRVYVYDAITRGFTGIMADNVSDARTKLNAITEEKLIESRVDSSPLTEEEIQDWKDANEIVDDSSDSDTTDAEDDSVDLASLFALSSRSTFSVYDDVKAKLIAKGIPEREIAFIHDYHTANQKNKLFQAVRDGTIRVLLGSTQKMGAGMNAQDRLVAVHHLDAPWRPSDLEQRNGRIIRQGNKLYERDPDGFEIEEFRYATKQTYDTRMWQIIEHKARGVEQLRHADETSRTIDDISGEAASAADMKAAASGNPLILDEIKLRNEISSLEAQEQNYMRTTFDLQRRIQQLEKSDERYAGRIEGINAWTSVRDKNPIDPFKVEIGGKTFTERKEIGGPMVTKIGDAYASASQAVVPAGTYRGVQFGFQRGTDKGILYGKLSLNGKDWQTNAVYDADKNKFSPSGFLIRIDNELTGLDGDKAQAQRDLAREKEELAKAQVEVKKPFSRKDTLAEARVKHREVVTRLQASGGAIEMTPAMKEELALAKEARGTHTADFSMDVTPGPTFYSALTTSVEALRTNTAPPGMWKSAINNMWKKGVKKEEIEWSGVNDWLDGQTGKVTKQQIVDFLRANEIKVTDVMRATKGGTEAVAEIRELLGTIEMQGYNAQWEANVVTDEYDILTGFEYPAERQEEDARFAKVYSAEDNFKGMPEALRLKAIRVKELSEIASAAAETTFENYTLPGGKNYHELLLTLPQSVIAPREGESITEAMDRGHTEGNPMITSEFRSNHFDESNIVAHIRFNDRTDTDGKRVLFIEEVQSDWHQKGRKEGYLPAGWKETGHAVPDAPFKTTWPMLAMRRMIRYAADNGYDRIAWTTGEQQADRYDLSKQISQVTAKKISDGNYRISARNNIMRDGRGAEILNNVYGERDIPDVVGKDLAERIIKETTESPDRTMVYNGLDLKVGGEGMKGFYDQMLPNEVNKYVKKWGGKVGETNIIQGEQPLDKNLRIEPTPVHSIDITPAMRDSAMQGQPMFEQTGATETKAKSYVKEKETPAIKTLREAVQRATGKTLEEGSFTDAGLPESFRGVAEAVKKIFGKDVVFFRNNIPDTIKFGGLATGADTKNIYVNVEHKQPFVYVTGHELLHLLRKERPDIYYRLYQIAKQEFDQEAVQEFGTLLTKFAARNKLLRAPELDKVHEEMLANFVGDQFARPDFWSKLAKTEPETFLDLARMVYDYLRRLLTMAKGRLGVGSYRSSEYFRDVERMRDAAGQALSDYAENHRIMEYGFTAAQQDTGTMFAMTTADRERVIGDSGRQYTPEQRDAMRRTGSIVTKKTIQESAQAIHKDAWKRLAQGLVDQFAPVKDISSRAYTLLRLSKGATGAFEALMKHGKLSLRDGAYDADISGGVLDRVFIPLGRESTDFLRWIAGNRAEQLAAEDREHLFSPEDIAAFKSLDQGTTAFDYTLENGTVTRDRTLIYRDSHKKFNEFNKNVLDMAEQSGLIDGESRSLWEREFYVPFYRVEEEKDGGVRGMNIKSGVIRQEAFKKLKGGEQALNDLMSNTLMNWAHLIDAAAKNRAAEATIEAAALAGVAREATWGEKDTVWYMKDGKKAVYKVSDPYILTAISALEYAGLRGPAMDALSSFKHWLTIGVTASPFFKIRNLIRDSMQAVATADLSYNVLGNVSKGYKLTHRERQEYVSAMAGGGLIRFGTMLESNEAARTRQLIKQGAKDEHILDNESKVRAFYDKYLEPAVSAYNELGNRGEEINRMALYDRMIRKGVGHAEASLAARDLLDFSMRGSWTGIRFLTQVVPFMNARAQGLYKLGRSAKEDPARFATVLGATALFSVALMAGYADDDDWKKREDWDRDNYWWFKLGGVAFRIPKPFEIGAIATLAERGAELMTSDEMTGRRFMNRLGAVLSDNLSMNPIPQLAKPLIDIYANVDSFTGRPIESMGMERLAPDYRFRQSTSMPARAASTAGNALTGGHFLSPVQVDHLVRGYFSWLGSFVVGSADMLARSASSEPSRPASDYWKVATGGLVSETEGAPSRYVTQMYDQAKIIEEAYGTWKEMIKEGKSVEAKDYFTENRDVIGKYRVIERVKREQTKLNQMRRRIENSDISPDEKRDRINKIRENQDKLARQVSQAARF